MRLNKRTAIGVVVAVGLFVAADLVISVATRQPAIVTIAPETTFITRPLGPDGYVDYVAALNEISSEDVTPENNSAVLFWAALGPSAIDARHRGRYFQMLGTPSLPEQGEYFLALEEYVQATAGDSQPSAAEPSSDGHDATWEQLELVGTQSWTADEFPLLAEWLTANQKPLDLLIEASKRPRRFDPLISEDGTILAMLLPAITKSRQAAEALTARAMLRVGEGQFDLAWQDLTACHRLARLVGQGSTLIDALVAGGIDAAACAGDQGLLQSLPLTAAQVATMRNDLADLGAMPKMVDKIAVEGRFMYLSAMLDILRQLSAEAKKQRIGAALLSGNDPGKFDWDHLLRMGNSWYDRTVAAGCLATRARRVAALQTIDDELEQKAHDKTQNGITKALSSMFKSRQAATEAMGYTMLSLTFPSLETAFNAEDRAVTQLELVKLACALAAYRADHDAYPESLADLRPDYVSEVPQDLFSDAALHYELRGNGYLLYSVGLNGTDDGGKGVGDKSAGNGPAGDGTADADWDDQAVRVPAASQ